jgi:hypothetical protein
LVSSKRGVGGFFEAIVAMMVITVGVAIVTSALGIVLADLGGHMDRDDLERSAELLLADILDNMSVEGPSFCVSYDIALSMGTELPIPQGANGFEIVLKEAVTSGSDITLARRGVETVSAAERVALSQPVIVVHALSDRRAALMTVIVW